MSLSVSKFDKDHLFILNKQNRQRQSWNNGGLYGSPIATSPPLSPPVSKLQTQLDKSNGFYQKLEHQLEKANAKIRDDEQEEEEEDDDDEEKEEEEGNDDDQSDDETLEQGEYSSSKSIQQRIATQIRKQDYFISKNNGWLLNCMLCMFAFMAVLMAMLIALPVETYRSIEIFLQKVSSSDTVQKVIQDMYNVTTLMLNHHQQQHEEQAIMQQQDNISLNDIQFQVQQCPISFDEDDRQ